MTTELSITDAELDAWCAECLAEPPATTPAPTPPPPPIRPRVQDVLVATGLLERVEVRDLIGPMRFKEYARPRQLAMYVARSITGASYPQIGRNMGDRDHTTILFGARLWACRIMFNETDRQRAVAIARLAVELAEERLARTAVQMEWIRKAQANPALVDPARQMVVA